MRSITAPIFGALAVFTMSGCGNTPMPSVISSPSAVFEFPVDCGPISDEASCARAVEVAATAKLNPPPIVDATIRRPRAGDDCLTAFRPCGSDAVIVVIQSGDTLQDVALIPSAGGWVRLDVLR
jgi:hypothetical protein